MWASGCRAGSRGISSFPVSAPPDILPFGGLAEPFSAISHLAAAAVFLVLGCRLVWAGRGSVLRVGFLSIYAVSCVFLFAMSGLLHAIPDDRPAAEVVNRLDHGAIFVMIAGTFTGVHGVVFHGWFRWAPLMLVWVVTAAAVTLKTVFFEGFPEWLGLSFYLGLGWGVALTAIPIYLRHGPAHLAPLFCGGGLYSAGALLESDGRVMPIPGVVHAHELWHVMVIGGALLHWWFVWKIATELREDEDQEMHA